MPGGADGAPAAADEPDGAASHLPRGVAASPLQALLRQDVPGGEGPPIPCPLPTPGLPQHPPNVSPFPFSPDGPHGLSRRVPRCPHQAPPRMEHPGLGGAREGPHSCHPTWPPKTESHSLGVRAHIPPKATDPTRLLGPPPAAPKGSWGPPHPQGEALPDPPWGSGGQAAPLGARHGETRVHSTKCKATAIINKESNSTGVCGRGGRPSPHVTHGPPW